VEESPWRSPWRSLARPRGGIAFAVEHGGRSGEVNSFHSIVPRDAAVKRSGRERLAVVDARLSVLSAVEMF
jgi:hypothetical protein